MALNELRVKRGQLAEQMKALHEKTHAEARAMTADESAEFDRLDAAQDELRATIERAEKADKLAAELEEVRGTRAGGRDRGEAAPADEARAAYARAFRTWVRRGTDEMTAEDRAILRSGFDPESRALTVGTGSSGGYTLAQDFSNQLDVAMKAFGGMLEAADIIDTDTGAALPWPTMTDVAQTGALLGENTQVSNQDVSFGVVQLDAYKYSSKQILVPVELLQDSAFNVDGFVSGALAERLGRITNTHFTTGTGTSQPNGVVTAATLGVTGATGSTLDVKYANLVDLIHSVDPGYRRGPKVRFMMHDSSLAVIRKIVDSQGRPLWQAGLTGGAPDTILGYPFTINQDMAVMAANAKSILFGDFSKYKIRRVKAVTMLRLVERYADYHQVGFLGFMRADGDLIDAGTHPITYYKNSAT